MFIEVHQINLLTVCWILLYHFNLFQGMIDLIKSENQIIKLTIKRTLLIHKQFHGYCK